MTFVMVQFSATAYSPRLVLWLARDPVIAHALGVFTATFLYAVAALAWVDRILTRLAEREALRERAGRSPRQSRLRDHLAGKRIAVRMQAG